MTTILSPEQLLSDSVLSTQKVREIDSLAVGQFGMNSLILMENAGLGCFHWILKRFPQKLKTLILCGPGNNGGDGLVITRHLRNNGWDCHAILMGPAEKFSNDTRHHCRILGEGREPGMRVVTTQDADLVQPLIDQAELVIDAMLGTGASGNPRPPFSQWIEWANSAAGFRLAIDIPTGVNADSGQCGWPVFHADATLTFVALKPSMILLDSQSIYGNLHVLPIGIPEKLILQVLSL